MAPPKPRINWPALAFGLSLVAMLIALVSTYSRQVEAVDQLRSEVRDSIQKLAQHTANTAIHLDPARDEERWNRLYKELDEIKQDIRAGKGSYGGQIGRRVAQAEVNRRPVEAPLATEHPKVLAPPPNLKGEGPDLVGLFKKLGRKVAGKGKDGK
jgi:hypothetical protein